LYTTLKQMGISVHCYLQSGKTILIYYVLLILTISMTVVSRYLKVRKNTKEKYHVVVKNRTAFITQMLLHKKQVILDTPLLQIEKTP